MAIFMLQVKVNCKIPDIHNKNSNYYEKSKTYVLNKSNDSTKIKESDFITDCEIFRTAKNQNIIKKIMYRGV